MIEISQRAKYAHSCRDCFDYPLLPPPDSRRLFNLAGKTGLNEAILLIRLDCALTESGQDIENEDRWVQIPIKLWRDYLPFWSIRTIKSIITKLTKQGLILSRTDLNREGLDRKKWYSLDYEKLREVEGLIDTVTTRTNVQNMHNGEFSSNGRKY